MADEREVRTEARGNRGMAGVILGIGALIGAVFVAFLIYYAVLAPERVAPPTESLEEETPSEGVGVPDGGELTNVPTQTPEGSPSQSRAQTEQQ